MSKLTALPTSGVPKDKTSPQYNLHQAVMKLGSFFEHLSISLVGFDIDKFKELSSYASQADTSDTQQRLLLRSRTMAVANIYPTPWEWQQPSDEDANDYDPESYHSAIHFAAAAETLSLGLLYASRYAKATQDENLDTMLDSIFEWLDESKESDFYYWNSGQFSKDLQSQMAGSGTTCSSFYVILMVGQLAEALSVIKKAS